MAQTDKTMWEELRPEVQAFAIAMEKRLRDGDREPVPGDKSAPGADRFHRFPSDELAPSPIGKEATYYDLLRHSEQKISAIWTELGRGHEAATILALAADLANTAMTIADKRGSLKEPGSFKEEHPVKETGGLNEPPSRTEAVSRTSENSSNPGTTETKTFYRVNNAYTGQGLWYDYRCVFTGLIHNQFAFCKNKDLAMDFDSEIVGFVSVVETLEQLYHWFTKEDIVKLQEFGWYIYEYQSDDYRWYDRFQHYIARQSSLKDARKIKL